MLSNVLQSERDALAKELHEVRGADDQNICPTVKKQAVSRQVGYGAPRPSDAPVRPERCDELVARSPSRTARGFVAGGFATRVGVGQGDVRKSEQSHRDHVSAASIRGEHDHGVKFANVVTNQCRFERCRVGEASSPGPRIRRLLRPVEGRDVSRKTTQEDSDSDAPLLRPIAASVESGTIPASSGSVAAFRRGGRENELLLHRASSIAPSVPEFQHPTRRSARLQAMRSRASHRRGPVVEVAPNVVDASAVALPSSPRDH